MQVQYIVTISGETGKLKWEMQELLAGLPDDYTALEQVATGRAKSAYSVASRIEDQLEIEVEEKFPEEEEDKEVEKVKA